MHVVPSLIQSLLTASSRQRCQSNYKNVTQIQNGPYFKTAIFITIISSPNLYWFISVKFNKKQHLNTKYDKWTKCDSFKALDHSSEQFSSISIPTHRLRIIQFISLIETWSHLPVNNQFWLKNATKVPFIFKRSQKITTVPCSISRISVKWIKQLTKFIKHNIKLQFYWSISVLGRNGTCKCVLPKKWKCPIKNK